VPIIYHYTNAAGLIGIIENKVIWATNVWFMNDTGEATFGWDQIQAFLRGKSPSSEAEESVISATLTFGDSFGANPSFPDSYIACFTENANDLSQWRAYGGTSGFSIGFDSNRLNRLAQNHVSEDPANSLLRKVVYSDTKQQEELQALYDQHV
jgi:hypothetical protein